MKGIEPFNGPYGMWQIEANATDSKWNEDMVVYTWLGPLYGEGVFASCPAMRRARQILCITSFADDAENDDWITAYIERDNPEAETAARWLLDFAYACR